MTDYITSHEIGHCVQNYFCPESDNDLWREYLTIRDAPKGMCKIYDHWDENKQESIYMDKEDFYCLKGDVEKNLNIGMRIP